MAQQQASLAIERPLVIGKFDWIVNANGTISLRGNNGKYISSENGQAVMKCDRATIAGWETFTLN